MRLNSRFSSGLAVGVVALLSLATAQAHVIGDPTGFARGVTHPLTGLDHLAALVALGIWAAQRSGRSAWLLPSVFLGVLSASVLAGTAGVPLPWVERGIAASVLLLGLCAAMALRPGLWTAAAMVALSAWLHGHAHATEMPWNAAGAAYGAGLVFASALVVAAGFALPLLSQSAGRRPVRMAAWMIAGFGGILLVL